MSISRRTYLLMASHLVFTGLQQTSNLKLTNSTFIKDYRFNYYGCYNGGGGSCGRNRYSKTVKSHKVNKKIRNRRRMRKASRKANRK